MILVAVLGFRKDFVENIRRIVCGKDNILITDTEAPTVDILIISRRKLNCYIRTKILIIADDSDEFGCIKADMAISCGISDRNTITLSSSVEGSEMASLQREILSINEKVVVPQEIELKNIFGSATEKLMVCALRLVLEV